MSATAGPAKASPEKAGCWIVLCALYQSDRPWTSISFVWAGRVFPFIQLLGKQAYQI